MWQILKWLWSSPPATALEIEGDGQFGFQVVGESHYQRELERIAGGKSEESCEKYVDAWSRSQTTRTIHVQSVFRFRA